MKYGLWSARARVICLWLAAGGTRAGLPVAYDADVGNPAAAGAIESPVDQGWVEAGSGSLVSLDGVVDINTNAWRIRDDASGLNPAYTDTLSAQDLQQMYLNGWIFEMTVRVQEGDPMAGFCGWGVSTGNDPGWGLTDRERVGFSLLVEPATDAFQVISIHGGTLTLAPGSATSFHTLRCQGGPLSSQYEFFVDGNFMGVFDIRDGGSNSNYDNVVRFASGSTAGVGREARWSRIRLSADEQAIALAPTGGSTDVDEEGSTTDEMIVSLAQLPTAPVTVTVTPGGGGADLDLGQGPGAPVGLTFLPGTWDTPQTVTVAAVDDLLEEGDEQLVVNATGASSDAFYDGTEAVHRVTVLDNDVDAPQPDVAAEVFVSPRGSYVTDPGSYHTFRIPSLLVAPDGSLLAFAEGRRGTGGDPRTQDNAPIDLVMKRSTDNGVSWGALGVIDPGYQPNGWRVDFGDPTTVVDETTEPPTVVLMYGQWPDQGPIHPVPGNDPDPAADNQVVWTRTSTDHGVSWSPRTQVITPEGPSGGPASPDGLYWRYLNPGPGNGIQLGWQDGANAALNGRLIIPAKRSGSSTPSGSPTVEPVMFYSDDQGATWQIGHVTAGPDANEDEVVELSNGQVLLDARQNSGSFRRRHLSSDGGVNWGPDVGDDIGITPVDCSLDRYSARRAGDDRDRILFSGPAGNPLGSGTGRYNLAVWTSYDEGDSFINPVQVNEGFAAYSVVRTLPAGRIGVLVETAADDGAGYGKIEYFGLNPAFLEGMDHPAALTHYDGFGNRIDRARGGTGWSGAWDAGPVFTDVAEDVFGSASIGFAGLDRPRMFGRMDLVGGQSTVRDLVRDIDLGADGNHYLSLLVSRQLDSSPNGSVDEGLTIELRDDGDTVHASFGVDSEEAFFVDDLGARQAGAPRELTLDQSYLLVLKIAAAATGDDQLFLKAYPDDGVAPDAAAANVSWTVVGGTGALGSATLSRLALLGDAEAHWSVDEIRIGETWASVAGAEEDLFVPDPDDADLWAWFDAGDSNTVNGSGVDLDGDPLTHWLDRTTAGLHSLLRATDGTATYATNLINGLPALRYDGDVDTWGAATAGGEFQTLPNGYTLVCVARLNDLAGVGYLFDRSTRGGGVGLRAAYDNGFQWEAFAARSTGAPDINTSLVSSNLLFGVFQTHILVVEGTNLQHYIDGTRVADGTFADGGVSLAQGGLILGADVATENDADCDIAEVLAYSTPLSVPLVQSLSAHFTLKYDLTNQVPLPPPPEPPAVVDVFTGGVDGYPKYRIPALLTTTAETVLAFCEARVSLSDHAENDMVLRRSLDQGETWEPMQVLFNDGANSLNDPLVVQVREGPNPGRIFLFCMSFPAGCHTGCVQPGYGPDSSQNYMLYSDDDGVTWSSPSNVTTVVRSPVSSAAGTPGQGIQMRHGPYAGRLVFVLRRWPGLEMYALYSDDGGDTWIRGAEVDESQVSGGGDEVQVAELADGRLMLNTRRAGGAALRKIAYSSDGGATWTPLEDSTLIEPTCDAGFHRYTDPLDAQSSRLLYVGPYSTSSRVNGSLHVSYDEGLTWPVRKSVYPGAYAYSKVTTLPDQRIGVLFERDNYAHISFTAVTLDWLTDGADALSGPGSPVVTSEPGPTAIEVDTAFLNGTLVSTGTAPTAVGMAWGPTDEGLNEGAWSNVTSLGVQTAAPPVLLTHPVAGLVADSVAFYRLFAANSQGTNWTPIRAFTPLADSDGDGISDVWEIQHCGGSTNCVADAQTGDNDTYRYLDEYWYDFDPAVSNAPFRLSMTASSSTAWLAFGATSAQRVYTVEWSTNLLDAAAGWQLLGRVPGEAAVTTVPDATPADRRYYRVRIP